MAESTGASTISPAPIKCATDISQVSAAVSVRFDVLELIGVSETVAAYLARDKKNPDLLVMLRLICGEALRDPKQVELFCLEAEAAARLKHRNIVRASKATSADGFHFMAVEHRAGSETLRSLLDRRGWLEPDLIVKLVCQVSDALNYAHGLGVLHLNLHPDNLLIDRDGNVLITDFGIEVRDDSDWAHRERSRRMPARYISPEQARGDRVNHYSDLYSLGIVLFEMLTDRLPFNAANSEAIKRKHITQPPLPPHIFSPGVSQPLSEITMKLLEKKPAGRFRDGAAIISILSRMYDISLPVAERPAHIPVRNGRPAQIEPQETGDEQQPEIAAETGPSDEAVATLDENADSTAGLSQETGAAEEEAPLSEAESRVRYETPAISALNYPVRQFYESADSHEVVSRPSGPFIQEAALASTAAPRSRWLAALVIAALVVAAAVIALARADYLPNVFRFNMAESAPAQNFQPGPDSSQPLPTSDAESKPEVESFQGEPSQPRPQDETPPAGKTDEPAATQSATGVAPRVQKPRVKKSVRRSKPKPRRYQPRRRAWF